MYKNRGILISCRYAALEGSGNTGISPLQHRWTGSLDTSPSPHVDRSPVQFLSLKNNVLLFFPESVHSKVKWKRNRQSSFNTRAESMAPLPHLSLRFSQRVIKMIPF